MRIPRTTLLRLTRQHGGERAGVPPIDTEYWLRSCEGFDVWGPGGRVGIVEQVRERDLVVAAGLFRRRVLVAPLSSVVEIEPERMRLVLAYDPAAVTIREHAEGDVIEVRRPARTPLSPALDSIDPLPGRTAVIGRVLFWWAFNTVALGVAVLLVGSVTVTGVAGLALAGLVLGLLNAFVKPILNILGAPFHVITLGLSLFVVNVVIIALTGFLVDALDLGGFVSTLKVTVIVWAASLVLHLVMRKS